MSTAFVTRAKRTVWPVRAEQDAQNSVETRFLDAIVGGAAHHLQKICSSDAVKLGQAKQR